MLVLPAELTSRQATACLDMLLHGLRQESQAQIVADASALTNFDSSALAVLLAFRRECLSEGKTFVVQGMAAKLRALAGVYGVADLLPDSVPSSLEICGTDRSYAKRASSVLS